MNQNNNHQLQQLTSSGWRTIATGNHTEVKAKFHDLLTRPGERRILDHHGTQTAYVKIGSWSEVSR